MSCTGKTSKWRGNILRGWGIENLFIVESIRKQQPDPYWGRFCIGSILVYNWSHSEPPLDLCRPMYLLNVFVFLKISRDVALLAMLRKTFKSNIQVKWYKIVEIYWRPFSIVQRKIDNYGDNVCLIMIDVFFIATILVNPLMELAIFLVMNHKNESHHRLAY